MRLPMPRTQAGDPMLHSAQPGVHRHTPRHFLDGITGSGGVRLTLEENILRRFAADLRSLPPIRIVCSQHPLGLRSSTRLRRELQPALRHGGKKSANDPSE